MKIFISFIFLFQLSLFSDSSQIKEMDSILKSELGISQKKVDNEPITSNIEKKEDNLNEVQISIWDMVSKVLIFLCVLAIILYFILSFLKTRKIDFGSSLIFPIDSFKLSGNKTIQMIKVSNKIFVLGVSDNSINLISEINSENDKNQINQFIEKRKSITSATFLSSLLSDFKDKVGGEIKQNSDNKLFDDNTSFNLSYKNEQKNKLSNLKNKREELSQSI